MLDFSKVGSKEQTIQEVAAGLTIDDLRRETHEMIDRQLALISGATDADVVFVPDDPEAKDTYAESEDVVDLAWTLGHVIVHTTASSEESAFLAAEMARGVLREGRSRYETPWETVTTIEQCRQRLEESRGMRLATLDVWPADPHLDLIIVGRRGPIDAVTRFIFGLLHEADHLDQIAEIMRQSMAARETAGV